MTRLFFSTCCSRLWANAIHMAVDMARKRLGSIPIPYQADMQPSICENYARIGGARRELEAALKDQVDHSEDDEQADDEDDADNPEKNF